MLIVQSVISCFLCKYTLGREEHVCGGGGGDLAGVVVTVTGFPTEYKVG